MRPISDDDDDDVRVGFLLTVVRLLVFFLRERVKRCGGCLHSSHAFLMSD